MVLDTRKKRDIEALMIWAIRDQAADLAPPGVFVGSLAALDWTQDRVDCSGSGGMFLDPSHDKTHVDALALVGTLRQLVKRGSVELLIVKCARAAARPDCMLGALQYERVPVMVERRGKQVPKKLYDKQGHVLGIETRIVDRRPLIIEARNAYVAWWEALDNVAKVVMARDSLKDYTVTGLSAPPTPWVERPTT